jgi:hypothetical protein
VVGWCVLLSASTAGAAAGRLNRTDLVQRRKHFGGLPAGDVAAVMCVGDSWMTGLNAAQYRHAWQVLSVAGDYRGGAWACGNGEVVPGLRSETLGTLMRRANPRLFGLSSGTTAMTSPCNKAALDRSNCSLNVATDGAVVGGVHTKALLSSPSAHVRNAAHNTLIQQARLLTSYPAGTSVMLCYVIVPLHPASRWPRVSASERHSVTSDWYTTQQQQPPPHLRTSPYIIPLFQPYYNHNEQARSLARYTSKEKQPWADQWKVINVLALWGDQWWSARNLTMMTDGCRSLLGHLRSMRPAYVNLLAVSDKPSSISALSDNDPWCALSMAVWKAKVRSSSGTNFNDPETGDPFAAQINQLLLELAEEFDDGVSFVVRFQPVLRGFTFQQRLGDPFTCFHPSTELSSAMAWGLLQNMQAAAGEGVETLPIYASANAPEDSRITLLKQSPIRNLVYR